MFDFIKRLEEKSWNVNVERKEREILQLRWRQASALYPGGELRCVRCRPSPMMGDPSSVMAIAQCQWWPTGDSPSSVLRRRSSPSHTPQPCS